ncbi:hypothetical protein CLOM_g14730, partial [Closterium sp. NIES-68]
LNIGIARNGSVQLSLGVVDHLLLRRDLFLNAVGIRESLLLLRQESLRPRRLTDHVVQNPLRIRLRRDRRLQSRLRGGQIRADEARIRGALRRLGDVEVEAGDGGGLVVDELRRHVQPALRVSDRLLQRRRVAALRNHLVEPRLLLNGDILQRLDLGRRFISRRDLAGEGDFQAVDERGRVVVGGDGGGESGVGGEEVLRLLRGRGVGFDRVVGAVDHIGARAARLGHEVRLRLGVRGVEGREQARGDDQEGQQESGTSRHGDDEKRGVAGLAWVTDREW